MRRAGYSVWATISILANLLLPMGAAAAPPAASQHGTAGQALMPTWFTTTAQESAPQTTIPTWFATANRRPAASTHHTIYPNAVTVTGPSGAVNNCDVVTFTIVATNDAVTTTNVVITSSMPAGFTPTQRVFDVGSVSPNETITRYAVFSATCDAVSGQNVVTLSQQGYDDIVLYTDYFVNPGAITVRKEPAVIPATIGDVVTWTVIVENTGYGRVDNVVVTDVLGSGLEYVAGITSTSYSSIPVGQTRTFTIAARVAGCDGLENVVTATWGCPGQQCLTPQMAKGAVDLAMSNPDLAYTLPDFDVPYCAGSGAFTITITNNGDGTAYSGTLSADLSPFSVTVSSPGASYDGSAFHLPPVDPGGTYNLAFTLTLPSQLCTMARGGRFDFDLAFYDLCGNPYSTLTRSANWQLTAAPGELSVDKTMPAEVYRGQNVTTTVTVDASGIVGTIAVTDRVPAGWSVVDPGGGTVFTVGSVTYITWTLSGSTVLTPVFATPDAATGCDYCGLPATNVVTATASDCQDCLQTATAQATTQLQCEEPVATSLKQVSAPVQVCTDPAYVYTNTYTFADTFLVTPTWQGMVFTETLDHQTYSPGTASVWMSDGTLTCTAAFSEAVVNGMLVITDISPTCAITVPGSTMWIGYQTSITEPSPCDDYQFYDWSYLDLGVTGNAECAVDGVIEEGVFVGTLAPQMDLSISGLPENVSTCGVYTVTLTALRTSSAPAYDTVIDVPTTTYYVVDVLGFGGATPAYTLTDGSGYHWYYADAFTTATTATIDLRVRLRCGSGAAPFEGTIHYDNLCADNTTYRERCSAGGTLDAPPIISSIPILTKFPEMVYAQGDVVTWTLIAYNSGAGPAYSVVLTDALGSDLRYVDSSITSTQGSVAGVTPLTSSNLVTWNIPVIQPKERVTIRYTAEIIGCDDLTNRLSGTQGCLDETCMSAGPVQSHVELPPTILLNTNQALTPIDTCYTRTVTVTVRNAGLLSVYSATLTETLPLGLHYITGTTEVSTDTVNWQPGPDPVVGGQHLNWGPTSGPPLGGWLSQVHPGETIYLRYHVYASCPFGGGQLRIQTGYLDTCGNPYLTTASYFVMPVRQADLTLIKAGQNLSRTSPSPTLVYAEPGEPVVWTITVTNSSSAAPARDVIVTDTLPGNLVFWGATPGYSGPTPGSLGGVVTWTLGLINPGNTVVLTLTTVVSQPEGCTVTDTYNTAEVAWGCPDGCRQSLPPVQATLRTRPVYDTPTLQTDIPPNTINQCGGVLTVTLNNQGPPAYNVVLTDVLPTGFVYSGTLYASTSPSGVADLGGTVVYTWAVLPTGWTTITFEVVNSAGSGGCAVPSGPNVVTLAYDDDIADCYNTATYSTTATVDVDVVGPQLVVDKSPATFTAQVGQRVTWTVTVQNVGQGTAYNMAVTDVVASSFSGVTATNGSDGSPPAVAGNAITWNPNPIPPGGTWTAQVSAVLINTGVNRNVVTATGYCDTGCLATTGSDVAYVTLLQRFDKGPPIQTGTIGSLAVFTFTAFLPDIEDVYEGLILTDGLPVGLGYVASVVTYTWDADGSQGGPVTVVSATPTVTPGWLDSGDVVWALGDMTGTVQVEGVLTAVIQDVPSNYDGLRLTNVLTMAYTDDGQFYVYTDTADVDVVEPVMHLGKTYVTPPGCSATFLQDNFNVPDTTSSPFGNWVRISNYGEVRDGLLHLYASGDVQNGTVLSDFSLSLMARKQEGHAAGSALWIVFRTTGDWNQASYILEWRDADCRLLRYEGFDATLLAFASGVPDRGGWHHFEVRAEGPHIQAYVDGSLIFDVTDDTYASGFTQIRTTPGSDVEVDDVLITRFGQTGCTVGAGDLVTYTLVVSNQGRLPGYDLVITDALPAGMSLVTYTMASNDPTASVVAEPAPIPGATGILTWGVNHLTPTVPFDPLSHTALTITVVLQVADSITANVTLPNQASLFYDNWEDATEPVGIDRDYSGGSHSTAVRTVDGAILKAVVPPTATLGNVVTYLVTVPAPPITATLYAVTVTDQLDPRLRLHTVTDGPDGTVVLSGNTFTVTYPSIPHGQQRFITITAVLSDPLGALAGDVVTNVALLTHTTGTTTSNQVSFTVTEPALTLVKASQPPTSSTVRADETVTYTVRITNASGVTVSAAYDLAFTDTLPAGMRATPPTLLGITLDGVPVPPIAYATGYNGTTGILTVTFIPAFGIPAGSVLQIRYAATVDTDVPAALDLTNQAEVTYSSLPGAVEGDRDYGPISDTTTVHTPLAVGLHKEAAPPTVTVGSQVVFTITVPNPAIGAVLHNVVLTDVVDGRLQIESVSPNASFSGQVVTATFSTIPTYTQQVVVITATVRDLPTVTDGAVLTNAATFDYRDNPSGPIGSNVVTVTVAEPHVTLDKSVDVPRDPLGAGDIVTYTLAIPNTGNWPAYDLVITDSLPTGLSFVATVGFAVTDPATATLGGDYPAWTISQLNVGGYVYITFTAQVAWDISAGLTLTNSAWGSYDNWPGEPPYEREYDIPTDTVPVQTGYPLLDLVKEAAPVPAMAGEPLAFTLTVTNTGIVSATGVVITDAVPTNTTYQSCGPAPCGEAGGVVSWTLGTLDIGAMRTVTMAVLVNADATGQVVNTGQATSTEGVTDTDTVTVPLGSLADLTVVKADDPDPVVVGTLLTYTLVVTNNGPSVARNVVVTDTLPPEVAFVTASPAQDLGPNPLVWNSLGDLDVGESLRLTVVVRVNVTTTDVFTNFVVAGSSTSDDNPGDNADDEPTTPLVPGLEMVKTVAPGQVVRWMPFTYTIRITNTGDVPLNPLALTDTLPAAFHYVAGSGSPTDPDIVAEPVLVWHNLGPLAPGASITVAFAVTATPGITGTFWNVATTTGEHPGGVLTDTDNAPVSVIDPAVVVDKRVAAVDLDEVMPNFVTFTIVITNVGVSVIDDLPLLDQYDPYYLSFVDATPYPDEDDDDGLLTWYDLTGPVPNGFGHNLSPGGSFTITTVFSVVHDITTTVNTAIVTDVVDVYNNTADEDDDDATVVDAPTAAELLYFRVGEVTGREVTLEWATAVEVDNFGFNLYRAAEPDRSRAALVAFVPSQAHGGGATYAYNDTVPDDGVWWYWLADVSTSGEETFHGPVSGAVGTAAWTCRLYLPLVLR